MTGFYMKHNTGLKLINPFQDNIPFLDCLKTSEKIWFSGVFWGYRDKKLA